MSANNGLNAELSNLLGKTKLLPVNLQTRPSPALMLLMMPPLATRSMT
jgi:hypothetical protein